MCSFVFLLKVSDDETLAVGHPVPEKDVEKILVFVTLMMRFKSRLVTLNGGDPSALAQPLVEWIDGMLSNGAQQLSIESMVVHSEELKKALQIQKPIAEQVSDLGSTLHSVEDTKKTADVS